MSSWPKNDVAADPRGGFFVVFVPPITDVNAIRVAPDGSTSRWMRISASGYTSGYAGYPYAGYPVVASGAGTLLVAWNVYSSDHVKVAAIDVSTPEISSTSPMLASSYESRQCDRALLLKPRASTENTRAKTPGRART